MPGRKYRTYTTADMVKAKQMVEEDGMTIYKAAAQMSNPWSSLKRFIMKNEDDTNVRDLPKLGRPFALSSGTEVKLYNYIIAMQELRFGLTVVQVRKIAFSLAKSVGRQNFFNEEKEIASSGGGLNSKQGMLYHFVSENLAAYRASMANSTMLEDFYSKLESLMDNLGIKDVPSRIWNCDETGLSYVVKPNRVVTAIGKRYVYKRSYADRGETTILGCVCADGSFIPPLVIFKGVRWNPDLARGCLPNALIKLSPKGWINSEIFLEWFNFFIASIPKERPVILLMDSHASHINPEVIDLAENEIFLFTFPAHTSHLLQPLDVGVYCPLKAAWTQSINEYMRENKTVKPSRYNFHEILNPAFLKAFSIKNIEHAFRKSGIISFNGAAIPGEAIAPSKLTENVNAVLPVADIRNPVDNLLELPRATPPDVVPTKRKKGDKSAKCLTPLQEPGPSKPQESMQKPGCSKTEQIRKPFKKSANKPNNKRSKKDDEWDCGVCGKSYTNDMKQKKNGAKWIQCFFCRIPYHVTCQSQADEDDEEVFKCDGCSVSDSE